MPQLGKLVIAIALAIVGAGLNWVYLQSQNSSTNFLAINRDLKPGSSFPTTDEGYTSIPMPNSSQLVGTLIAYKDRGSVYGARVRREFKVGDPIFFSDVADDIPRY